MGHSFGPGPPVGGSAVGGSAVGGSAVGGPAVGAGPLDVHVLFLLLQVQFSAATHPFLFPLKVLQTTGTGAEVGTSVRRG